MPRVLVTGGTGAIGPAVVRELKDAGWTVDLFRRPAGDLRDPDSLRRAPAGADAVVHMAALLHTGQGDFQALNVDATRTLVEASRGKRFIFFSTIAVYGSGGPFDEDSPLRPQTEYARTKLEAERIVLDAGGIVLRVATVYGSRVKGNYASLVRAIARGTFPLIGDRENHRTLVHEADVAQAVVLALDGPAGGRIYNVTDGATHAMHEIVDAIAEAMGKRSPRVRVPVSLVRAAGVVVPRIARLLENYLVEVRIDGSRIARELQFVPQYDLRSGWREALSCRKR